MISNYLKLWFQAFIIYKRDAELRPWERGGGSAELLALSRAQLSTVQKFPDSGQWTVEAFP